MKKPFKVGQKVLILMSTPEEGCFGNPYGGAFYLDDVNAEEFTIGEMHDNYATLRDSDGGTTEYSYEFLIEKNDENLSKIEQIKVLLKQLAE